MASKAKPKKGSLLKSLSALFEKAPVEDPLLAGPTNVPVPVDASRRNPFREMHLLHSHEDIVRLLIPIDDNRVASASDDSSVVVWHVKEARRLCTLCGHRLPITCGLVLRRHEGVILLTGSSDRSIRAWDVDNGRSLHELTDHNGTVKCLASLGDRHFVSGGKDLTVWNKRGEILGQLLRKEEDSDIRHLLYVANTQRLITASDTPRLHIYSVHAEEESYRLELVTELDGHREAVRAVIAIPGGIFASASLDGAIHLWSARSLSRSHVLNHHDHPQHPKTKVYTYSVKTLQCVGKLLLASIGNGFAVFDVQSGERLTGVENAHYAAISHLTVLAKSMLVITASVDCQIRVWRVPHLEPSKPAGPRVGKPTRRTVPGGECVCVGELMAHTGAVNRLLPAPTGGGFLSCGTDKLVVLWQDALHVALRRSAISQQMLQRHVGDPGSDDDDDGW